MSNQSVSGCPPGQILINGVCKDDPLPDPPFAGCEEGYHWDSDLGECVPDESEG